MRFKHIIITALRSLRINRSRSILTILGIVIGIASIILIISLGEGAQRLILGQVQGIGSRTIAILPGRQPTSPADVAQLFSDSLRQKDIDTLEKKKMCLMRSLSCRSCSERIRHRTGTKHTA